MKDKWLLLLKYVIACTLAFLLLWEAALCLRFFRLLPDRLALIEWTLRLNLPSWLRAILWGWV